MWKYTVSRPAAANPSSAASTSAGVPVTPAELSEVAKTGLAGVEIGSTVDGASLADDRFEGFFAEAERLRTPIFVHAAGHPDTMGRLPAAGIPTFGMMTEIGLPVPGHRPAGSPGRYMTSGKPITVAFSVFIRCLASAGTRVMVVVMARSRSIPSGG
jgi:hypothetical protein